MPASASGSENVSCSAFSSALPKRAGGADEPGATEPERSEGIGVAERVMDSTEMGKEESRGDFVPETQDGRKHWCVMRER